LETSLLRAQGRSSEPHRGVFVPVLGLEFPTEADDTAAAVREARNVVLLGPPGIEAAAMARVPLAGTSWIPARGGF
jgi:hypothetical protein